MAYQDEIVLAVTDEPGVRDWLAQTLEDSCRLKQVGRDDLMRVLRMLEATDSQLVMVEMDEQTEQEVSQSLAIISTLTNARPWVVVIALCRYPDQQLLLRCMRAGARDCLVLGGDAEEARERLREHQQVRQKVEGERVSRTQNLMLLASASPLVDTTLLGQELALAVNHCQPGKRVLAIDLQAYGRDVFYLEGKAEFGLMQLLQNLDTLDETLIDTAVEEYRPGLRLLRGGFDGDSLLRGDHSADLFIAVSRLMSMFDLLLVNVGCWGGPELVRTLGIHARHVLLALHPLVDQAQATRDLAGRWQPHLGRDSKVSLLLDGVESSVPPAPEEVAQGCGLPVLGCLPMEWAHRLEAKNLGLPMQEVHPHSPYCRQMQQLASGLVGVELPAETWWKRLRVASW
jgi:pilus assembly protein CpaE